MDEKEEEYDTGLSRSWGINEGVDTMDLPFVSSSVDGKLGLSLYSWEVHYYYSHMKVIKRRTVKGRG